MLNMGQVKGHPLTNLAEMGTFQWPDPNNRAGAEGSSSIGGFRVKSFTEREIPHLLNLHAIVGANASFTWSGKLYVGLDRRYSSHS